MAIQLSPPEACHHFKAPQVCESAWLRSPPMSTTGSVRVDLAASLKVISPSHFCIGLRLLVSCLFFSSLGLPYSLTCSLLAFSASSTLSLSPSVTLAVSSCTWASSFFLLCSDSALTCCSTFTSQANSLLSDSRPCLFFSRFALN